MSRLPRSFALAASCAALFIATAAPAAPAEPEEQEFLTLLNAERTASGLAPLQTYWDLEDDAAAHSLTMRQADWLHHNPDLAGVTTGWWSLGENVGVGPSVTSLHAAFMNSPGHAANVRGDYRYVGIGVVVEHSTKMWVTIVFMNGPDGLGGGSPAAPLPATNPVLSADATNVGLVNPGTGHWYLRRGDGSAVSFTYGDPGDYPILGDWDCDGISTPGLYRQSDGYVYLRNSNSRGTADYRFYFGNPSDLPVAGDFNGNGCDTVGVYRPAESRMYVINRLGSDDRGLGVADYFIQIGGVGRSVIAGDFNGDGVDTFVEAVGSGFLAGDWNNDGRATTGRFNDAAGHFTLHDASGAPFSEFYFGDPNWMPVGGDAKLG